MRTSELLSLCDRIYPPYPSPAPCHSSFLPLLYGSRSRIQPSVICIHPAICASITFMEVIRKRIWRKEVYEATTYHDLRRLVPSVPRNLAPNPPSQRMPNLVQAAGQYVYYTVNQPTGQNETVSSSGLLMSKTFDKRKYSYLDSPTVTLPSAPSVQAPRSLGFRLLPRPLPFAPFHPASVTLPLDALV